MFISARFGKVLYLSLLLGLLFLGPLAKPALGQVVDVTKLQECTQGLASNVSLSGACGASDSNGDGASAFAEAVVEYLATCLSVDIRPLRIMTPSSDGFLPVIRKLAARFEATYNVSVTLTEVNPLELEDTIFNEMYSSQSVSDGWIIDPSWLGDLASNDAFLNLLDMEESDSDLAWDDISYFTYVSSMYGPRVAGVPLDGDLLLLYYRRDLFLRYGLKVPVTWEEFVALARQMNGTDTDGDGHGDLWGVCLNNAPVPCDEYYILTSMMSPYLQYNGTEQGVFIDPKTMIPLMNNSAVLKVVELYQELSKYNPNVTTCSRENPFFSNGSCLMTINFGDQFKANAFRDSTFEGSLGVSRLPGTYEVYNRDTNKLQICTSNVTCPYAKSVTLANGTKVWMNYAPFSGFGSWTGVVNARAPSGYQALAYKFYSFLVQPENSLEAVLDPESVIDPYRRSQITPDEETYALWTTAGYDRNATELYLAAVYHAMENGNTVLDTRLEQMTFVTRSTLGGIADNTTWFWNSSMSTSTVISNAQLLMEDALNDIADDETDIQRQYCMLLGCYYGWDPSDKPQFNRTKDDKSDSASNQGRGKMIIIIGVTAPIMTILVATCVGLLVWRRTVKHRHLLKGVVKAPMAGPETSLLITDIQDSTSLWESLPEDVMDAALRTHHSVVRHALAKHDGYESATEGDSFILAFHSAGDAVACAMRIQTELIAADWQQALLNCALCDSASEVWQTPARGGQHNALMEMLSSTGQGRKRGRRLRGLRGKAGATGGLGGYPEERPGPLSRLGMLWHRGKSANKGPGKGTAAVGSGGVVATAAATAAAAPPSSRGVPSPGFWEGRATWSSRASEPQYSTSLSLERLSGHSNHGDDEWCTNHMSAHSRVALVPLGQAPSAKQQNQSSGALSAAISYISEATSRLFRKQSLSSQSDGGKEQNQRDTAPWGDIAGGFGGSSGPSTYGNFAPTINPPSAMLLRDYVKSAWVDPEGSVHGGALAASFATAGPPATTAGNTLMLAASRAADSVLSPTSPFSSSPSARQVLGPDASASIPAADDGTADPVGITIQMANMPAGIAHSASYTNQMYEGLNAQPGSSPNGSERMLLPTGAVIATHGSTDAVSTPPSVHHQPSHNHHHHGRNARQLAFRGLRVRMGIHSGVPSAADVSYNQAEARYHYTGTGMALARGVQGAAAGGQVLLSDATFALIRGGPGGKRVRDAVLLHMGEHELDSKLPGGPHQLYQALPRQLLSRLALLPPVKVTRTVTMGVLDAPVGRVSVAFLTVAGVSTLLAWNAEVTRRALEVFNATFAAEASQAACGGSGAYIVESTGGLLLAVFASPTAALATCRSLQCALLGAEWPQELLEHDLCEEVATNTPHGEGTYVRELLFRGLRVKAGIDCGPSRAALNGATGRVAYRGRVMNRAARISSQATSGQVLCSRAVWQAACEAEDGGPTARGLTALSLGNTNLKGISEPVEVLEVRLSPAAVSGRAVILRVQQAEAPQAPVPPQTPAVAATQASVQPATTANT